MAQSSLAEARALLLSPLGPVARAGSNRDAVRVSFEFFPPKTDEAEANLWKAIRRLEPLNPVYVSVTYGAGGSTRERTHRTVQRIIAETSLRPAAHLTCVEASRDEVDEVIEGYKAIGVDHIVALRGDPPNSGGTGGAGIGGVYQPRADGYANATELTAAISRIGGFDVTVGAYPEKHPESPSIDHDIEVLKAKVDAGATRAVSQQTYDNAVATRDQAVADVMSAKAALDTARINVVYTKVLSPIDGIIGRSAVTEGALVTANQATALAAVQQIDPIYVDVTQSSVQLLRLQNALSSGQLKKAEGEQAALVTLTLEDGSQYTQQGKLQFSEVTVDPGTGSVTLRAVFPNPDRRLLPGMFVRARLVDGVAADGLLVPQRGVTRNQRGLPTALVVNAENKVELRELKTDRAIGDQWLVTDGLKAGEKVIVEGVQMVRPGVEVVATEAGAKPAQQPQAGAAAAKQ